MRHIEGFASTFIGMDWDNKIIWVTVGNKDPTTARDSSEVARALLLFEQYPVLVGQFANFVKPWILRGV